MTAESSNLSTKLQTLCSRFIRSWYFPAGLTVLLVVGLIWWLVPRKVEKIVTVDGQHEWRAERAPARRQFVWQPAEAVAAVRKAMEKLPEFEEASLIHPQLTDAGSALYFTLRKSDGSADVYVSRLKNGRWQLPEPVAAWNSSAADIGPAISSGGREAYFYSNRPGGWGGFDLYVSRLEESGWSSPQNLGPLVNTPAHEYDPALDPDGRQLFFSSNRTEEMRRRIAEMAAGNARKEWSATLRAHPGLGHFDLYAVRRDDVEQSWASPLPLTSLNRADANEGSPAVAPNGIYLYFASDRRGGEGGYDLYRARLRNGDIGEPENLGASVNTANHEMEPALSPEGFTLVFSSDRNQRGERYSLYESRAVEVTEETAWDATNWQAFTTVLKRIWLWMLLLSLLLLALFLLWRRYSQTISEKTLAARFLLTSLMLHLLLLLLAGFVTISRAVLEEREKIIEVVKASEITDEGLHESHEKGLEAYEKLADLKSVDEQAVSPQPRQTTQPQNIPNRLRDYKPTIPSDKVAKLSPDRVRFVPRKSQPTPAKPVKLTRRPTPKPDTIAKVTPEPVNLPKAEQTAEQPIQRENTPVPRRKSTAEPEVGKRIANLPRKVSGAAPTAMAELRENTPNTTPRKVELAANRTPQNTSPLNPAEDTTEPQTLKATPDTPENPVTDGMPAVKKSTVATPNTAETNPASRMTNIPRTTAPARTPAAASSKSPSGNAAPPSETPLKLARTNPVRRVLPTEIPTDNSPTPPAAGDTSPETPLSPESPGVQKRESTLSKRSSAAAPKTVKLTDAGVRPGTFNDTPSSRPAQKAVPPSGRPVKLARTNPVRKPLPKNVPSDSASASIAAADTPTEAPVNPGSPGVQKRESTLSKRSSTAVTKTAQLADTQSGPFNGTPSNSPSENTSPQSRSPLKLARTNPPQKLLPKEAPPDDGSTNVAAADTPTEAPVNPGSPGVQKRESSLPNGTPSLVVKTAKVSNSPLQSGPVTPSAAGSRPDNPTTPPRTGLKLARTAGTPLNPAEISENTAAVAPAITDETGTEPAVNAEDAERGSPVALQAPVRTPSKRSGPQDVVNRRLSVGQLSNRNVNTPPSYHPRANRLQRKRAKGLPVAYARESVGIRRMFTLRQPDIRTRVIPLIGVTEESEAAVDRGLHWLARHQFPDGHWGLHNFNKTCEGHKKCNGHGNDKSDTAATGFALLPFLGRGQTHQSGEYKRVIGRGLNWLLEHQKDNGDLFTGGTGNAHMYSHGIAAIALCEAYGMTGDPKLKRPAQKAIDFIVAAQHKGSGGWRYRPGDKGDTSVVGWQVMALKSAEMAGLNVPQSTFSLAGKWLDSVESNNGGRFGYTGRSGKPAMTAEGLLCRQFLGARRDDDAMLNGVSYLMQRLPERGKLTSYYWYYATQVMYHMQGDDWSEWNTAMRHTLLQSQEKQNHLSGTWKPSDQWEKRGGRIYSTSLRLLMLEAPYRHLPLYRHLGQ